MGHSGPAIVSIIVCCVFCAAALAIHVLHFTDEGYRIGIFKYRWNDEKKLHKTLALWWHYAWTFVLTVQVLWMIHSLASLCRRDATNQNYVYKMVPWTVYLFTTVANVARIAYVFLLDQGIISASVAAIFTVGFLYVAACAIACRYLEPRVRKGHVRDIPYHCGDLWMVRAVVLNSTAAYAAISLVDGVIKVAMLLKLKSHLSPDTVATGCLVVLLFCHLLWTFLDLGLFGYFTRFIISPYVFYLLSHVAIISYKQLDHSRNNLFSYILISFASVLLVCKCTFTVYKQCQRVSYARVDMMEIQNNSFEYDSMIFQ